MPTSRFIGRMSSFSSALAIIPRFNLQPPLQGAGTCPAADTGQGSPFRSQFMKISPPKPKVSPKMEK
jgi:hypothetical protein